MRRHILRFVAILVVFAITLAPTAVFAVESRESAFINSTAAGSYGGDGSITVKFSITGTTTMSNIGVTTIKIYTAGGTFAKGFYYSTTSGMMGYNRSFYASSVTWDGATSGTRYYAVVTFKASNSSGSDYYTQITGYATA